MKGLEDFHFHTLRHTYTSNLLSSGAKPKDVQELLGHSDVSTTMNIYAHSIREAKRTSARLLDSKRTMVIAYVYLYLYFSFDVHKIFFYTKKSGGVLEVGTSQ